MKKINNTIKKALSYIATSQAKNGSFSAENSTDILLRGKTTKVQNTFFTSLILYSLYPFRYYKDLFDISQLIKRTIKFIQNELNTKINTANYWLRNSKEYIAYPVPDDLDVTSVALLSLSLFDVYKMDTFFSLLTEMEVKTGGPYNTWIVPRKNKSWKDIDLGVNINILGLLAFNQIFTKNLLKYIVTGCKNSFSSLYYEPYVICYLLSKAITVHKIYPSFDELTTDKTWEKFVQNCTRLVLKYIKKNYTKTDPENNLAYSCMLNALLNLKATENNIINYLVKKVVNAQKSDGSYKQIGFSMGHYSVSGGKRGYDGSRSLNTAIAIEGLQKYLNLKKLPQKKAQIKNVQRSYSKSCKYITKLVAKNIELNKKSSISILNKIFDQGFTKKAYLLYFEISSIFGIQNQSEIFEAATNGILGWIYFYIDDLELDKNRVTKDQHSIKEFCKEQFLKSLNTKDKFLKIFIGEIVSGYNKSTKWELSKTRFSDGIIKKNPNYGNFSILGNRAIPYILGISVLFYRHKIKPPQILKIKEFFMKFLTAKQLADDTEDYLLDFKKGSINSVGSLIIKNSKYRDKKSIKVTKSTLATFKKILMVKVGPMVQQTIDDLMIAAKKIASKDLNKAELERFLDDIYIKNKRIMIERKALLQLAKK